MVQGVGFRYTTQEVAQRFAVTGYVKNLRDGRVLLAAEGAPEELDRFLAAVARALGRYVDSTEEVVLPATGEYSGFSIRF